MKNKIITITLMAGILALTGCATTSSQQQTAENIMTLTIPPAAAAATALVLQKNPTALPDFELGAEVLTTIATGSNSVTAAAVNGTLASAKETNPVVITLVDTEVTTITQILGQQTNALISQQDLDEGLSLTAEGIEQGIAIYQLQQAPAPTNRPPQ